MELTPEQINDFIAKAVIESQIGDAVKASIARVMNDLKQSYNNPFDSVIKSHVTKIIDEQVKLQYRPILEEKIKEAMATWATEEVLAKIIDAAMQRLESKY